MITRKLGLPLISQLVLLSYARSLASTSNTASSSLSDCTSDYPWYIGDGFCNDFNNNEACDWDGGDCCHCDCNNDDRCGFLDYDCRDPSSSCGKSPTPGPIISSVSTRLILPPTPTASPSANARPLLSEAPAASQVADYSSPTSRPLSTPTPSTVRPNIGGSTSSPAESGQLIPSVPHTVQPVSSPTQNDCRAYGGNGSCDNFVNNEGCAWDGGDCCECTCVDGEFDCGQTGFDCRDGTCGTIGTVASLPSEVAPPRAPQTVILDSTGAPIGTAAFKWQIIAIEIASIIAIGGVAVSFLGATVFREPATPSMARTAYFRPAGEVTGETSIRKPSETLAFMLTLQLQFLATLSLVEFKRAENVPWLREFGTRLRWVNLWWPKSSSTDVTTFGDTDSKRSLILSSTCSWKETATIASVRELVLVMGIAVCIFLIHLLVVSGLEAYWLLEKQAKAEIKIAQRQGVTQSEMKTSWSGGSLRQRVMPMADDIQTDGGHRSVACFKRPMSLRQRVESSQGGSIWDTDTLEQKEDGVHEEGCLVVYRPRHNARDPIVECRDKSTSAWLHFPHVELVFLLFAFEGFVAAQVSAARNAECLPVFITASTVLVLYPVFMFVGVCRTTLVRVCSNVVVEFKRFSNENHVGETTSCSASLSRHDRNLLCWADKGRWLTVQTPDGDLWRERNWFRVGFEPIFVDFTQYGAWFVAVFLLERAALACVAVLVDNVVVQLFVFCAVHLGVFIMLVVLRPFANKVIDFMASAVAFANAVSTGIMAASALVWKSNLHEPGVDVAVAILQLSLLCALVLPIYIDGVTIITTAIRRRVIFALSKTRLNPMQMEPSDQDTQTFVRHFIRHAWAKTWRSMFARNLGAFVRDTREGIRKPRVKHRNVVPRSCMDSSTCTGNEPPRRPRVDLLDTASRASMAYCSPDMFPRWRNGTDLTMITQNFASESAACINPIGISVPIGGDTKCANIGEEIECKLDDGEEKVIIAQNGHDFRLHGVCIDDLPRRVSGSLFWTV